MGLLREIQNRKSVDSFSDKPLEANLVERILEAGRAAPSAKNRQPWRFIVATSEEVRSKLYMASYQLDKVEEAPVVISLCTTNVDYKMPNGHHSYPMDIAMAAAFMMLQAEAEGIGSAIIGTYDEGMVKEALSVPYSMRVPLLLLLGHYDHRKQFLDRKPLSSVVAYNHW